MNYLNIAKETSKTFAKYVLGISAAFFALVFFLAACSVFLEALVAISPLLAVAVTLCGILIIIWVWMFVGRVLSEAAIQRAIEATERRLAEEERIKSDPDYIPEPIEGWPWGW